MRRLLLLLVALVFANVLFAQNESRLHVRKLELVPNDTEASRAKKKDANGDKCALIKIQTPNMDEAERNRFVIAADRGTFVYPEQAVGELWVYLTEGVKILVIKHPDYGVLNYNVTQNIQGNKVYKLVLEADKIVLPPDNKLAISSNWVVVKMTPSDAIVTIDGKFCNNGKAMLSTDEPHSLVATHPFYHTFEKTINASANEKMTYTFEMAPAFGWLNITSKPENGATVLINNRRVGVTPYRSDTLASGEYEVTLLKDMYESVTKTVTVRDNNVGDIDIPMKATFAEIKITTDSESDIYVDDTKRGTGTWTGRLGEGEHIVEARKASHRNNMKRIDVVAGKNESINVANPTPIYGALNINTTPDESFVYLDGVKIGETPMIKNSVLIGEHSLRFEKQGCAPLTKTVNIIENQMINVDEKLVTGKEISISTDGTGDKIYVDGSYIGVSPITSTLSFGEHEIKAVRDSKESKKTITVAQSGGETSVKLMFFEYKTFMVNGVAFEMVYVKGGTFIMGCTMEQNYCDGDESPRHMVTVSDFMIGKFEVTRKLWKVVMGNNPRHFKSDDIPVENVSWNDCQEFVKKLNEITGYEFRLLTESEWEYAARGGNRSNGYVYSGSNNIDDVAWYSNNSGGETHPVGQKTSNELGIYDMSGNVWEWCQDWKGFYGSKRLINPIGASSGSSRVVRGGSWYLDANACRVSDRTDYNPDDRNAGIGLRLALSTHSITDNFTITTSSTSSYATGVFSISQNQKVQFSMGNLQYHASTNTWRFAEHQWDVIGDDNENISVSYSGWIDLFGWGTGNTPTNSSVNYDDYVAFNDWGNNTILNGGGKNWFTLTEDEWVYIFDKRSTNSGIRYAKATVNGVSGVILLPDNWNLSNYSLSDTNMSDARFNSNNISRSEWMSVFEANGAVFLPSAESRKGAIIGYGLRSGSYWSATRRNPIYAETLWFNGARLVTAGSCDIFIGNSVRLVSLAE